MIRLTESMGAHNQRILRAYFPIAQVALLFLLLGAGCALIPSIINKATVSTLLLFFFITVGGLLLCRNTQARLEDRSLRVLGYFWLIKLSMMIFLLYVGWIPQLEAASSSAWGYDPQRFYIQAQELIDNNWLASSQNLNYMGILYYYGAIYYVFGHNPVIPLLINAFVTLIATLYLVRVGYEIKGHIGPRDWTLAFALLLPEVVWYDVITSRETLSAALMLFGMLTVGRYLARTAKASLAMVLIISGISLLALSAVRTSMLIPVFASIILMLLLVKQKRGSQIVQRAVLLIAAITILIIGPIISVYLGGYEFNLVMVLNNYISGTENMELAGSFQWSEKSIGLLLIPNGLVESIIFLPARMMLYLVSPLPNIAVSFVELISGSFGAWQKLLIIFSSVINVLIMPYAMASLVQAIKMRKRNANPLIIHIPYWVSFTAIAGGNLIIHERYRVMVSLLLWGCAWLGARTCSKNMILRTSLVWYGTLGLGGLLYTSYKYFSA